MTDAPNDFESELEEEADDFQLAEMACENGFCGAEPEVTLQSGLLDFPSPGL